MQYKFIRSVKELVAERLDSICLEFAYSNKKYIRLHGRSKRLQDEVMECLSDEGKKLFLRYDELEVWLNSLLQKAIYRKGIRDGIRLANISRKITKL